MSDINNTPTFPGDALDWAIAAAEREAERVRSLQGVIDPPEYRTVPHVLADYEKRLAGHAETLRTVRRHIVQA
jgi:hypothetical protein